MRNVGGVISNVEREFNHHDYGTRGNDGDITVVIIETPLVWTPVVQAALIVAQGSAIPDNLPVVHAGWGATTVSRNTCIEMPCGSLAF